MLSDLPIIRSQHHHQIFMDIMMDDGCINESSQQRTIRAFTCRVSFVKVNFLMACCASSCSSSASFSLNYKVLLGLVLIMTSTAAALQTAVRSTMEINSINKIIYSYSSLRNGILVNRYKRFLADIEFEPEARPAKLSASSVSTVDDSATAITVVHCPNTGSMYKLIPPANLRPECACSTAPEGSKRKYPNTLEMIKENNAWVGVHSALANSMVENALNLK
jgi:SfsA N-terminal OB domain